MSFPSPPNRLTGEGKETVPETHGEMVNMLGRGKKAELSILIWRGAEIEDMRECLLNSTPDLIFGSAQYHIAVNSDICIWAS
jgi:hypothetical protein